MAGSSIAVFGNRSVALGFIMIGLLAKFRPKPRAWLNTKNVNRKGNKRKGRKLTMNETKIMLPAAGSLTDFFTAISTLANEYQAAGNAVLIGIALLILGKQVFNWR